MLHLQPSVFDSSSDEDAYLHLMILVNKDETYLLKMKSLRVISSSLFNKDEDLKFVSGMNYYLSLKFSIGQLTR
jgi:hypothetical protein